ncbi:MAG: fatty acid desaturase [Bdellovibrionaceae bacterium]|nr:fatty acid desaturase [Pseudobdellovibrionaceae bacterium]
MDKRSWQDILKPFTVKSSFIAIRQLLVTFSLYAGVWYLYVKTIPVSPFLVIPFSLVRAFFVLRFFVLMHDCGHGAMFKSSRANQFIGYCLGVLTGMPQFVWSKHHAYHHTTNGDWEKYRGPLSIITKEEYNNLNPSQQRWYRVFRHPLSFVFLGGFLYVLFNPRFNWLVGTLKLAGNILYTAIFKSPRQALQMIKDCPSKKWKSPKEFRHMTYNNVALLTGWYFMCQAIGTYNFFIVYTMALSFAGGIGILFFTVQHNFEGSYAADTASTDYTRAALEGTSYLKLPAILNWFTADIAYHHIHHLSTSVPNYRLAACHKALEEHFVGVKRIRTSEVLPSLRYLLWDRENKIITSI